VAGTDRGNFLYFWSDYRWAQEYSTLFFMPIFLNLRSFVIRGFPNKFEKNQHNEFGFSRIHYIS